MLPATSEVFGSNVDRTGGSNNEETITLSGVDAGIICQYVRDRHDDGKRSHRADQDVGRPVGYQRHPGPDRRFQGQDRGQLLESHIFLSAVPAGQRRSGKLLFKLGRRYEGYCGQRDL